MKKKICFVATVEFAVQAFLIEHLRRLSDEYEITVIVSASNENFLIQKGVDVNLININFSRKIDFFRDFFCLFALIYIFIKNRFLAVQSITPKAGLLAMLAAFLVRTPLRIHTFTGQVWLTRSGFSRFFLKSIDKVIGLLSTLNIVDSPSQRDFLLKEKILNPKNTLVFGDGSVAGVDFKKFKSNRSYRTELRRDLAIPQSAFVFIYVGRIARDKGLFDLVDAFQKVNIENLYLVFVGPDEESLKDKLLGIAKNKVDRIRFVGFSSEPQKYMLASDVLCLPSYREGFGSVIVEAAAMGIPALGSDIYGIRDAVIHNKTGLLHSPRDVEDIKSKMEFLIKHRALTKDFGKEAKIRAIKAFDSHFFIDAWARLYKKKLSKF